MTTLIAVVAGSTRADPQGASTSAAESARQRAASGAYEKILHDARNSRQGSILVNPTDRSVWDESFNYIDAAGPKSMEDLILRAACAADAVVIGRPVSDEAFLSEDAGFVLTEYRVQIDTLVRGAAPRAGSTISYVRPGGKLLVQGRPVAAAHNMYPALSLDSDYLLFVSKVANADLYKVAGDDTRLLDALSLGTAVYPVGPHGNLFRAIREGAPRDVILSSTKSAQCG